MMIWTAEDSVAARDIFKTSVWSKMVEIVKMKGTPFNGNTLENAAMSGARRDEREKTLNDFAMFAVMEPTEDALEQIDMRDMSSKKRPGAPTKTAHG